MTPTDEILPLRKRVSEWARTFAEASDNTTSIALATSGLRTALKALREALHPRYRTASFVPGLCYDALLWTPSANMTPERRRELASMLEYVIVQEKELALMTVKAELLRLGYAVTPLVDE